MKGGNQRHNSKHNAKMRIHMDLVEKRKKDKEDKETGKEIYIEEDEQSQKFSVADKKSWRNR